MDGPILTNLRVCDHPLMKHVLGCISDITTEPDEFRRLMRQAAPLMLYEALADLETEPYEIDTPVCKMESQIVFAESIMVINILGAGAALQPWFSDLPLPHIDFQYGYLAMKRDEETLQATTYYTRLPEKIDTDLTVICEPMNATGGSISDAVHEVKRRGATNILCVHAVTARAGAERMQCEHPDVRLWTARLDEGLTDQGFIKPGLGDFGDRWNGC